VSAPPRRRGARLYLGASFAAQVCALIRYTALARLLGPEQLGLAATLILTSQFFDSVTDSGSDRYLIQDRDGDAPDVQRFVQLVFVTRGVVTAGLLVAISGPLAAFYHASSLASGLIILAISPLIFGFIHLDMRRAQRHEDFRTEGIALLVGEAAALCVTLAAALMTHNYMSSVYGLIVRSACIVAVSHLCSERKYALGYAASRAASLARFALPLTLNGLLLFLGSQGDRVLIGNQLGLTALGKYSAVILLIFYPSGVVTRYLAAIHLPRVAVAGRLHERHSVTAAERLAGQTLLIGLGMCAGFAAIGPMAVSVLYGAKFVQPPVDVCLIGILQTARFVRLWPNTAALAIGRSGIVLANNVARLVGLAIGLAAGVSGLGIPGVVAGLVAGEFLALFTAILLLNRATTSSLARDLDRFAILALECAALALAAFAYQHHQVLLGAAAGIVGVGTIGWAMARERATITDLLTMIARIVRDRGRRAVAEPIGPAQP
jgi:O-antigen/teichoic acid export membrane protein